MTSTAVRNRVHGPTQSGTTVVTTRCTKGERKTGWLSVHAGSRLKPTIFWGRRRLKSQPSSRTEENPPYGMIGGIEETSASFEARSAPRSYPTEANNIVPEVEWAA